MLSKKIAAAVLMLILLFSLVGCSQTSNPQTNSLPTYKLTVKVKPEGAGIVKINPSRDKYQKKTKVTLEPNEAKGYKFHQWAGSKYKGSSTVPLIITMNSDIELTAVFKDSKEPNWTLAPKIAAAPALSQVKVKAAVNEGGRIYYRVLVGGTAEPTAEEIKSAGKAVSIPPKETKQITINNLESGTNYVIFLAAEDKSGNLQQDKRIKKVEVKTKRENKSPVINSITNVSDGKAVVKEGKRLTFVVSVSDAEGGPLRYAIAGPDAAKFNQSKNVFSWTPDYSDYSSANSYQVKLQVNDGKSIAEQKVEIVVKEDTTAPTPPKIKGISTGTYNTAQSFTISGKKGNSVEFSLDGGSTWREYSSQVTISDEGSYKVTARQIDKAGNTSARRDIKLVTIDKTPPQGYSVMIDQPVININNEQAVSFTLKGGEVGTVYKYIISSEQGKGEITKSGSLLQREKQITGIDVSSLADGKVNLKVTLTDRVGNRGKVAADEVNKDTISPSVPKVNGISAGTYNTAQDFTILGETEAVIEYSTDRGENWKSYNGEVVLSREGDYEITVRQTDPAGNTSCSLEPIPVTIDLPPEWTAAPEIVTCADADSVEIKMKVDEKGKVYYKEMKVGKAVLSAKEITVAGRNISVPANAFRRLIIANLAAETKYKIYFAAVDKAGNLQKEIKKITFTTQLRKPLNPELTINVPAGTTSVDNGGVTLDYNLEMGKYEITNTQYVKFLNKAKVTANGNYAGKKLIDLASPSCQISYDSKFYVEDWTTSAGIPIEVGKYPVIEVTWYGAAAYCNWLSKREGLTPAYDLNNWKLKDSDQSLLAGYRLPTVREWEYAARGGAEGKATAYAGSNALEKVAWYNGNSAAGGNSNLYQGQGTMPVGRKGSNELGIYDMIGNVWEWTNTSTGVDRIGCGCSWNSYKEFCRVNVKYSYEPAVGYDGVGFRIVRTK